jgi:hypothetical protein
MRLVLWALAPLQEQWPQWQERQEQWQEQW